MSFIDDIEDTVGSAASAVGSGISDVASGAYQGVSDVGSAISGGVQWAEDGITSGVHSAEDWVNQGSHALASTVSDVPVLGTLAEGAADYVSTNAEVLGGVVGGATSLVGGVVNAVAHPLDTVSGLEALAEHVPFTGDLLRVGHNAINVVEGRESIGDAMDHSFNPMTIASDDATFWGAMGSAIIDPYRMSIDEGRYGEVAGRAAFDIGSLLLGAGEANAAVKGTEVAADAARASEVAADAARAGEVAADAGRTGEVAADAGRTGEVAADAGRPVELGNPALADGGAPPTIEGPGPGGRGPRYHSVYDDDHLVPEGAQPDRLPTGPDPEAAGAHTRLRWDEGSPSRGGEGSGRVYQGREFDASGNPVRDIDFTSPTYPSGRPRADHLPPPHQHDWIPNDPANPRAGFRRSRQPTPFLRPEE